MRIDMHAHFMPPSIKEEKEWLSKEPFWQLLVESTSAKSVQGYASAEQMLRDMDTAGIDQVVLQGEYFQTHEASARRNDAVLEAVRSSGGRLLAFAAIQPKAGPKALDELARCLDGGMRGVGEISPYAQGFSLSDSDFLRLAAKCTDDNIPLLLHTNDEIGRYYKGKVPTPLRQFYELAERFPDLRIILAHWGGGLFFYEIVPYVQRVLKNVLYDTAASPLLYPTESIFRAALACIAPSKIVYASDYPLLVYPRTQEQADFATFVNDIRALALAPDTEAAILGENAARLLLREERHGKKTTTVHMPNSSTDTVFFALDDSISVSLIANMYPATRQVFEKHGIEWKDCAVPPWEPIRQAAAANGLGVQQTSVLLSELGEAIKTKREK